MVRYCIALWLGYQPTNQTSILQKPEEIKWSGSITIQNSCDLSCWLRKGRRKEERMKESSMVFYSYYPVSQWQGGQKTEKHISAHPLPNSDKVVVDTVVISSFSPLLTPLCSLPFHHCLALLQQVPQHDTDLLSTKFKDQGSIVQVSIHHICQDTVPFQNM